jgi:hypothetical protein
MCSVTHVAAGALIGSFFDRGSIAFLVGFASHIPLDAIPHLDFDDFRVDAVVTIGLLGGILAVSGFSPIFWGALGAVGPDVENLLWKTGVMAEERKIFPTHSGLIKHGRASAGGGMRVEIIMSVCSAGAVALAVILRGGVN